MLEIKNVSKKYKNLEVLKGVNLKVNKGEVISIIGASGGGKSTLIKCINRLEEIDNGEILFMGEEINSMDVIELRQKIGIVFQEFNLFNNKTVLENLTLGLTKIKKLSLSESDKIARTMLKKVGLEEKVNNYPDQLSGGQKQRVAIARTLVMKPKIVLLDEPTSSLDKEMKIEVLNLILKMVEDDMTMIIISHENELVDSISDKIYLLEDGILNLVRGNKK